MSEVVNLRSARKQAQRAAAQREADQNAARHGRSKAERLLEEAEKTRAARRLDGHRLASPDED